MKKKRVFPSLFFLLFDSNFFCRIWRLNANHVWMKSNASLVYFYVLIFKKKLNLWKFSQHFEKVHCFVKLQFFRNIFSNEELICGNFESFVFMRFSWKFSKISSAFIQHFSIFKIDTKRKIGKFPSKVSKHFFDKSWRILKHVVILEAEWKFYINLMGNFQWVILSGVAEILKSKILAGKFKWVKKMIKWLNFKNSHWFEFIKKKLFKKLLFSFYFKSIENIKNDKKNYRN